MLYVLRDAYAQTLVPAQLAAQSARIFTQTGMDFLKNQGLPWEHVSALDTHLEIFQRLTGKKDKPSFDIHQIDTPHHKEIGIHERIVFTTPFCDIIHFEKDRPIGNQPRVLVVTPLSGHYATLLRDTVSALLPDHDVFVTDWHNALHIPVNHGRFNLDDYIQFMMDTIRFLGGRDLNLVAVCQPAVPVLAAIALMAHGDDPDQPASMTLMGGPIDTRSNPTVINDFATTHPYEWIENTFIQTVPTYYAGAGRRICPGWVILGGFMGMNLDKHYMAHVYHIVNIINDNHQKIDSHRTFYDEYLATLDMPAEYFMQTMRTVFQEHHLPRGKMTWQGHKITPSAIQKTALLTVEGEKDDISGLGQTRAAHDLCSHIPKAKKHHLEIPNVGHYGIFSGSRWRSTIMPNIRDFILKNS